MTTTAETPDRVLARKVSSRVVQMNSKAAEFESLIFLVVEHFSAQALHQAQNDKLEEAAACAAGAVLRGYDEGFERGDLASVAANAVRSLIQKD